MIQWIPLRNAISNNIGKIYLSIFNDEIIRKSIISDRFISSNSSISLTYERTVPRLGS